MSENYKVDRTIVKGDDRTITFWFVDTTVSEWDFFFTAKKRYTYTDEEADITVNPSEILFSDSGSGYNDRATIWLTHEKTDIDPGKYYYDIKIVKNTGIVNTIMFGVLEILPHQTIRNT